MHVIADHSGSSLVLCGQTFGVLPSNFSLPITDLHLFTVKKPELLCSVAHYTNKIWAVAPPPPEMGESLGILKNENRENGIDQFP